jgi:diguanylate cyclase (GGDEF)-like protein
VAVAHHVRGEGRAQIEAAEQCLEAAYQVGEPGWASSALSMRAMALVRENTVESALLDLARAETELSMCQDEGLAGWAHTGLGYGYLELRLYELALPHFERVLEITASPIPLREERTIDLMNLAELHLRWADELERATPYDGSAEEAARFRRTGHAYAAEALAEAERVGATGLRETCRAMELCSRPRSGAQASLDELQTAWESPNHTVHQGGRATVGGALARALWRSGRQDEALQVVREAAQYAEVASDWQVAAGVRWLLIEMEVQAGVPGARSGQAYGRLLSQVLWKQRLSTLQGASAALDVERLRHATALAQRAALEDPLTGLGNRRALEQALAEVAAGDHDDRPTSLLVVDLDHFKAVNDRHGHPVGDQVLAALADALRGAARSEDLVARIGGDEFVVLARRTDAENGAALAQRIQAAVEGLRVSTPDGDTVRLGASVGVGTTDATTTAQDLLEAADRAMYASKRRRLPEPGPHADLASSVPG